MIDFDHHLFEAIQSWVLAHEDLTLLDDTEAAGLLTRVRDQFVADPTRIWWWETPKRPMQSFDYGSTDGIAQIARRLPDLTAEILLVVTDDCPPPWPVVRGQALQLLQLLREQRVFEFHLVDEAVSWILFDTHHNSLITTL